jgi:hypothetical protein
MSKSTFRHAGSRTPRGVIGHSAIAVTAIGVTTAGVSIDDNHSKADTSIQQPEKRKPDESTGTPPQPERLDSFVDRAAEENTIVDGGSYVTPCSLGQQEGWIRGNVFCPRPNLSVRPGTRPVGDSNSNMSSAAIDSRKQPTSA